MGSQTPTAGRRWPNHCRPKVAILRQTNKRQVESQRSHQTIRWIGSALLLKLVVHNPSSSSSHLPPSVSPPSHYSRSAHPSRAHLGNCFSDACFARSLLVDRHRPSPLVHRRLLTWSLLVVLTRAVLMHRVWCSITISCQPSGPATQLRRISEINLATLEARQTQ